MPTSEFEDFPFPPVDEAAQSRLAETAELLVWDGKGS